jgi:uncharacterized protein (DUF1800 family)
LFGGIAIAAGLGGARLLSEPEREASSGGSNLSSKAGSGAAAWPRPADAERARIATLLRRTTFGYTAAELDAASHDGFERTVDRLIEAPFTEPPDLVKPDDPTRGAQLGAEDLQRWWLGHMLTSPARFAERMTYFWHGHFTSEVDKSGGLFMYWQNLSWRRMAFGKLGDMLATVTVDPAMLTYLDLATSDASDPTKLPNENYARELLELFSMGPGRYREADVKAAARALAGWTAPPADSQVEVVTDKDTGAKEMFDVWNRQGPGVLDGSKASPADVMFLGRSGQLDLRAIVDQVLARPDTAQFIARKVAVHFVSSNPAPETISELAGEYRRSGYEIKALLRAAFMSREFSAPQSYRSLVKSPVEFMAGTAMAVGLPVKDTVDLMLGYGDATGEALFSPPNVAGWPPNRGWVSPATVLARLNFVGQLLSSIDPLPALGIATDTHLDGVLGDSTQRRMTTATTEKGRWLALLASPEFQLK